MVVALLTFCAGGFQLQRILVRINVLVAFIEHLLTVNYLGIVKTEIKKKRPSAVLLKKQFKVFLDGGTSFP